jgi:hypothetical protein
MLSCPPYSHIDDAPDEIFPEKTPGMALPGHDLMALMQLSEGLSLDGEMTPIMALNWVYGHERAGEFGVREWEELKRELEGKTKCYGYVFFLSTHYPPQHP